MKPLENSYSLHYKRDSSVSLMENIRQCTFCLPDFLFFFQAFSVCPTLCDPVDSSLPGSSVCEILLARILEWVAVSSSRGSSRSQDWILISCVSCLVGKFFTTAPPGKTNVHRKCSKHKIRQFFFTSEKIKKPYQKGKGVGFTTEFNYNMFS